MSNLTINATKREELGKGASRRLRRAGKVPAIVYGGPDKSLSPVSLTLADNELKKAAEKEAFFASVLDLSIDGKVEQVVLMDVQRHPATSAFVHVDFERVDLSSIITKTVPLHYSNEESCEGVKVGGGKIQHTLTEVDVTCKASDLPEFIEVDMINVAAGDIVHLSDLSLPAGVELVALQHDNDQPVCTVIKPLAEEAEEGEEGEATAE